MTVGEVIKELSRFDPSLNVYVPAMDGKAEIAKAVGELRHLHVEDGISIPSDVHISPWTDDEFNDLFGGEPKY